VTIGLSFLITVPTGLWLSRSGRPLPVALSTVHKLVGLAAAVLLVVTIRQARQAAPFSAVGWVLIVVTGLLFAGLAATGGLLSGDRPMPAAVHSVHRIAPYLTVLSSGAALYLLVGR
jgi:hypothetical protein